MNIDSFVGFGAILIPQLVQMDIITPVHLHVSQKSVDVESSCQTKHVHMRFWSILCSDSLALNIIDRRGIDCNIALAQGL